MGEVYLAQDSKLDRKVALKILPGQLAGNEDRMRRFTQEAKAAAPVKPQTSMAKAKAKATRKFGNAKPKTKGVKAKAKPATGNIFAF